MEVCFWKTVARPALDGPSSNTMILGEVVGVHIDESILVAGKIDIGKLKPIARLGYMEFALVESTFSMLRPTA